MIALKTLKEYRRTKNFTQEELARQSGISIRTIQRIEKGFAKGSPHTLKALAKVLQVESTDIAFLSAELSPPYNDFYKVKLMNFSILTVLLIPFGNLIFPSLFFFKNKSDKHVNLIGRRILSIQILCTFIVSSVSILIFLLMDKGNGAIPIPVPIIYVLYTAVNILIVISTSSAIDKKKKILNFFPDII